MRFRRLFRTLFALLFAYLLFRSINTYVRTPLNSNSTIQSETEILEIASPLQQVLFKEFSRDKNLNFKCSQQRSFVFVREFYVSPLSKRNEEIEHAIHVTHIQNPCAMLVFIIAQRAYLNPLKNIIGKLQTSVRVFFAPGTMVMGHLFRGALESSQPDSIFAVSTADVAIASLTHLPLSCPTFFKEKADELMVVSRRDNHTGGHNCEVYLNNFLSWDVFIAASSLLDESKFDQMMISPSYWGIENLMAWVLLKGKPEKLYNLCPLIDVVHFHSSRNDQKARVRVNHGENHLGQAKGNLEASCNVTILKAYQQKIT